MKEASARQKKIINICCITDTTFLLEDERCYSEIDLNYSSLTIVHELNVSDSLAF